MFSCYIRDRLYNIYIYIFRNCRNLQSSTGLMTKDSVLIFVRAISILCSLTFLYLYILLLTKFFWHFDLSANHTFQNYHLCAFGSSFSKHSTAITANCSTSYPCPSLFHQDKDPTKQMLCSLEIIEITARCA